MRRVGNMKEIPIEDLVDEMKEIDQREIGIEMRDVEIEAFCNSLCNNIIIINHSQYIST